MWAYAGVFELATVEFTTAVTTWAMYAEPGGRPSPQGHTNMRRLESPPLSISFSPDCPGLNMKVPCRLNLSNVCSVFGKTAYVGNET